MSSMINLLGKMSGKDGTDITLSVVTAHTVATEVHLPCEVAEGR
jgi:hypothetical protein